MIHVEACVEHDDLQRKLALLVGRSSPLPDPDYFGRVAAEVASLDEVTFDQLTRILIAAGEDRISKAFFDFFSSLGNSYAGRVSAWRRLAMRHYGNLRFALKQHRAHDSAAITAALAWKPTDLASRPNFGDGLKTIGIKDTPLLGYIAGAPAQALRAKQNAGHALTESEQEFLTRFENARTAGVHNTYEYLCSSVLDVYVATSMRTSEEFYSVARFLEGVFVRGVQQWPLVRKVGYFDPTQSYHDDRIVKGIVEGLMLKRAACTVYLAQETDTMGKDSELATTLAQGKPVIAYLPNGTEVDHGVLVEDLCRAATDDVTAQDEEHPEYKRLTDRFQQLLFHQSFKAAWDELGLDNGLTTSAEFDAALGRFRQELVGLYDRRANTLLHSHPLGLQIHLETGVANGILVARTAADCRELIEDVLSRDLSFEISAKKGSTGPEMTDLDAPVDWDRYLIEQRTGSVYRVIVGDQLVSNAFWNWYLQE
jgi:hypothetical protein